MKKSQSKKHQILDIPVLGPIIASLVVFFIPLIIGTLIGSFLDGMIFGEGQTITHFCTAACGLLIIFGYSKFFKGEFKGAFNGNCGNKKLKLVILVAVILNLINLIYFISLDGVQPPSVYYLGLALTSGITEEAAFRMAPISIAMRKFEGKKSIVMALFISSVLFAVIHMSNLSMGQASLMTANQIIFALYLGLIFGAVYIRTGNILITIVWHTLYDIIAFLNANYIDGVYIGDIQISVVILNAIYLVVFIILSVYLLHGDEEEIEKVWKDRWNK